MKRRNRMPLVYIAAVARETAHDLLGPGVAAENVIERAIRDGGYVGSEKGGVVTGDGWQATVVRTPARLRAAGPRAWLITRIAVTGSSGEDPVFSETTTDKGEQRWL